MSRPRFSLRGLLLLTAALAAVCWYRDLPRQNAKRFARLIEAGDYAAAEEMFVGIRPGISDKAKLFSDWKTTGDRQGMKDWLRGRYGMTVTARFSRYENFRLTAEATAAGVILKQTQVYRVPHRP